MGGGIAIDPLGGEVVAPCDALVVAVAPTGHAVTLRLGNGAELLIHVGVDTVSLGGAGFVVEVVAGERVSAGQRLLRVDLDEVGRRAPSLVTPVVLVGEGYDFVPLAKDRRVRAGEPLARVSGTGPADAAAVTNDDSARVLVRVPLANGVHARPAARIVAALKPFAAEVAVKGANARSVSALLAAAIVRGEEVAIAGRGQDARAAVEALAVLIEGGMGEHERDTPAGAAAQPPTRAGGVCASPGLAVGPVFIIRARDLDVPEIGAGRGVERASLEQALIRVREGLGQGGIADAHRALLDDPEMVGEALRLIENGKGAAHAWRVVSRGQADRLRASGNGLLAERAADLLDLERQVIAVITGATSTVPALPPGAIVVSEELLPSQVPALVQAGAAGFCTAFGGPTSHAAILAASAGLPMVVAAGLGVLDLPNRHIVVLDADAARIEAEPTSDRLVDAREDAATRLRTRAAQAAAAQAPAHTADGMRVEVAANLAGPDEAAAAVALGAEGCGLLRTEFLFMDRDAAPDEEEQARAYADVAAALAGGPLIVRALDVGGDKPLRYLPFPPEENPALGARGIRLLLARPELLRTQFRAILRSVPLAQRRIMLPMIVDPAELRAARAILDAVAAELGEAPGPLGVMVETPAAAMLADELAREADFLSVGSNDLTQYALAADRGNAAVAGLLDPLHPAVLRLISLAGAGARARGRWLGVCGGVASDAKAAAILIGLGATELSVAPAAVPAVKAAVAAITIDDARALAARALACATSAEVRALLEKG